MGYETDDITAHDYQMMVLTCVAYSIIFVFGLVGNRRVVWNVLNDRSKQSATDMFTANLALANTLLCLFVVPVLPVMMLTKTVWPFGRFLCHLWPCIYYTIRYASMLTLATISLIRCWIIVHSFEESMTKIKMYIGMAVIWFVSLAISLPKGIYKKYQANPKYNDAICSIEWTSYLRHRNYLITTFIIFMVVPLIATAYSFIAVSFKISHLTGFVSATRIAVMTRTNRLIIAMATAFGICWMPMNIIEVLTETFSSNYRPANGEAVRVAPLNAYRVAHFVAMSSTCVIPLFYMCLNRFTAKQPTPTRQSDRPHNEEFATEEVTFPTYTS